MERGGDGGPEVMRGNLFAQRKEGMWTQREKGEEKKTMLSFRGGPNNSCYLFEFGSSHRSLGKKFKRSVYK